jgi:hypothetical protein
MAVSTTSVSVADSGGTARTMGTLTDPASVQRPIVSQDAAGAATYRAAILFTLGVATPTAVFVLQGSATKTIRIRRIFLQGWSTTAGVMKWKVCRRSTAGTLGSAVLTAIPTQGKNDSGTVAASTLTISSVGTANYGTIGTLTTILDVGVVGFNLAAQINNSTPVVWPSTAQAGQSFVLRGTSDWITVDGGADAGGDAVPAGGIICASFEWDEDGS